MFAIYTLILVLSLTSPCYAATLSSVPTEIIEASNSVFKIISEYNDGYASGTGFVISNDNKEILLATNYHVVEDNPIDIFIFASEDDKIHASVVCFSKQQDLAVLKLESYLNVSPIEFAPNEAEKGDAVYAIGFPTLADTLSDSVSITGDEATITNGIISAIKKLTITEYGGQSTILQTNADINHGNSGGAAVN